MRWILACVVCVLLACIWEGWYRSRPPEPPARALDGEPARTRESGAALEAVPAAGREGLVVPQAPEVLVGGPAGGADELLELLRRVATSYAAQDFPLLAATLETLLAAPARCEEALALVESGGLAHDEPARAGTVLTLGAAVARYATQDGRIAVDAHAFTVHVLERLAYVLPPEQQDLADQLIQAQAGERYVLDLSYLAEILALRREHPDQAEVYSSLLVHMSENLRGEQGLEEFRALFLDHGEDPTAVKLALAALLQSDASTWLPLAEDLFTQARNDPRMQAAIAHAIATSAPLGLACDSLARLAQPGLYVEFALLGLREGGSQALGDKYTELVSTASQPVARRMLVSAMRSEDEAVLVGIARTDPDPDVRTQALLTSSLGRNSGTALVDELIAAHDRRADPASGLKTAHTLLVAGNVLINSHGETRDRAKAFLMQVVGDATESDTDRLAAARLVKAFLPPGTFSGLTIGGQKIE